MGAIPGGNVLTSTSGPAGTRIWWPCMARNWGFCGSARIKAFILRFCLQTICSDAGGSCIRTAPLRYNKIQVFRVADLQAFPSISMPSAPLTDLVQIDTAPRVRGPKPAWLKAKAPAGENYHGLKKLARSLNLHTVCESAQCPNIGECWEHKTATFMMLGNLCTRRCGFCAVPKGRPEAIDFDEPRRVAEAIATLGLKHAVVTSVNRDDDVVGGARAFALLIDEVRKQAPGCQIEVLVPDFQGREEAIRLVVDARPEVLNHNTETVPRLYRAVRSGSRYERSLQLLETAKRLDPAIITKSGVMAGLGEEMDEMLAVFRDLSAVGVDILTVGQYLRPSKDHLPMARYYTPEEFAEMKTAAMRMGFRHVESGPLVRSSYHAHEQAASTGLSVLA